MSKVATIEAISEIGPHPNADALEIAKISGWEVCVKKGDFKAGDLCVYIAIDSILEEKPEFEFLRARNFKVKTIKLRGQVSQGICFTLNTLKNLLQKPGYDVGDDVSEEIGAKHWEKPIPANLEGVIKGNFPSFLHKTDEPNLCSYPDLIKEMQGESIYITQKMDGSSTTFYLKDGEFGVCRRNIELEEDENNAFWRVAAKYDLKNKLAEFGGNVSLQGELVGPGVQGNKLGLKELELRFFNYFDIDSWGYRGLDGYYRIKDAGLPVVPLLGVMVFDKDLGFLIEMANDSRYENGSCAEGIVIRPHEERFSEVLRGRMSAKVISQKFLLKNDE